VRGVNFTAIALEQFYELQKSEPEAFKKLLKLIKVTVTTPFEGIGKPELLKYNYKGFW
jgi:toxin YoeB